MDPSITAAMERGGSEWSQVPDCIRDALLSLNDCLSDIQRSGRTPKQDRHSRGSRIFSPNDPHSAARTAAHNRSRVRTASEKKMRQSKITQQLLDMHRSAKQLANTTKTLYNDDTGESSRVHDIYIDMLGSLFNHFLSATVLLQWTVSNFSSRQDFLHLGIPKHFYQTTEEKKSFFQFSPSETPEAVDPKTDQLIQEFDRRLAEARRGSPQRGPPPRRPSPDFDEVTPVRSSRRSFTSEKGASNNYTQRRPPTPTRSPSPSVASSRNERPVSRKSSCSSISSKTRHAEEQRRQEAAAKERRRKEAAKEQRRQEAAAEEQRERDFQHEIDLENERIRAEEERQAKIQAELEQQQADEIEELIQASRKLSRQSRTDSSTVEMMNKSPSPPASSSSSSSNINIVDGGISPHSEKESIRREKVDPDDTVDDTVEDDPFGEDTSEEKLDDSISRNDVNVKSTDESNSSSESESTSIAMATKNRLNDSESDEDDGGLKWG